MKWLVGFWLCISAASAAAEQLPFVRGSQQSIVAAHQGKPFILALWSLDCVHCRDDLEIFGKLQASYRNLDVVLVATDPQEREAEIQPLLKHYVLQRADSWIFADDYIERLRYEIDPEWYGELPRTYFFDADGKAIGLSGKIKLEAAELWVRQHLAR